MPGGPHQRPPRRRPRWSPPLLGLYECIAEWVHEVRKKGAKAGARLLEEMRDEVRRELVRAASASATPKNYEIRRIS